MSETTPEITFPNKQLSYKYAYEDGLYALYNIFEDNIKIGHFLADEREGKFNKLTVVFNKDYKGQKTEADVINEVKG